MKDKEKRKKVSFPHMGTVYIAWASALEELGIEAHIPPYTSKKTLSLGTKYSPEAICLPYKLILGNFLEAIEGGADCVSMITSPGICRLGEYGKSIQNTLKELGHGDKYVELNLYDGLKGMYEYVSLVSSSSNPIRKVKAILIAAVKVFALDKLEDYLSYYRAREIHIGDSEKEFKKSLKLIQNAKTVREVNRALKEALKNMSKVEINKDKEVLHVDLTGEIFLVLDYFANQNITRELGKMGVQVRRSLTVSGFLKDAIIPKWMRRGETHLERAYRMAQPYLMRDIGGDALECVSDVMYAHEKGKDGIIHISPFTCMPEIMSQNIFPKMREDVDIPILSLIMDEQTGKAGYLTRLEAFVDLMMRKKMKKKMENNANKQHQDMAPLKFE